MLLRSAKPFVDSERNVLAAMATQDTSSTERPGALPQLPAPRWPGALGDRVRHNEQLLALIVPQMVDDVVEALTIASQDVLQQFPIEQICYRWVRHSSRAQISKQGRILQRTVGHHPTVPKISDQHRILQRSEKREPWSRVLSMFQCRRWLTKLVECQKIRSERHPAHHRADSRHSQFLFVPCLEVFKGLSGQGSTYRSRER